MEQPRCLVCRNQHIGCVYRHLYATKSLLKCESCGLYFVWPRPSLDRIHTDYGERYYHSWSLEELGEERLIAMKRATFTRLLDVIERYTNKGKLLDVGCGPFGCLLEAAKERGWICYGTELSGYATDKAKERIGHDRIFCGDFLDLALTKNSFDVITMADVIEHFYDINAALRKCKETLRHNGLLAIITPDFDSLSSRYMGRHWFHCKEEHSTYLSKKNINKILSLNSFKLLGASSFNKAINFYYLRAQIKTYWRSCFGPLLDILNILFPQQAKMFNLFIPQGEMLIIAQAQ